MKFCVFISQIMAVEYERWMSWYGKKHGPYQIEKGDFLCEEVKDKINNATWVSALVLYVRLVESFSVYKYGNRIYFTQENWPWEKEINKIL